MVVVGSESQVFQNITAYMSNWVHHLLQSFGGADSLKMKLPPTRWAQKPAIHGVKWGPLINGPINKCVSLG